MARLWVGALASVVGLAVLSVGWLIIVYPKGQGPGRGREVRVVVRQGMDADALAQALADEGAIADPVTFAIYLRLLDADAHLRDGEVLVTDDMTPRDVLQRVADGFGPARVRITVPEGFDRFAIARRLARWDVCEAEAFLAATEDRALLDELGISGPSAEGYLFPDTYRFSQDLEGPDVVRRMVANWRRRVEPLMEDADAQLTWLEHELGWSPHEVLVLASIVEKEAAAAVERPTIARVFINRLHMDSFRPHRLQADPTVSYGCKAVPERARSCADFDGRITRAMLQDRDNPYNTYRHEGLPPGPICNPGLASIRAALTDESHRYLYFVARGGRRHDFSETLEQHNAAVARYRERTR